MTRADLDSRHPSDDALLDAYVDVAEAATVETREHVEQCDRCRERYLVLSAPLDTWRSAVAAEADDAFPETRLERQRHRIMARLAALSRGARVLAFPATRPRTFGPSHLVIMKGWVAAAAAAGLLVGLGLGRYVAPHRPATTPAANTSFVAPHVLAVGEPPAPGTTPASEDPVDDEQFMLAVADSAGRSQSRIRELQAIDQLTPRVSTVVAVLR